MREGVARELGVAGQFDRRVTATTEFEQCQGGRLIESGVGGYIRPAAVLERKTRRCPAAAKGRMPTEKN